MNCSCRGWLSTHLLTHCQSGLLNCIHHEVCELVVVVVGKDALLMHLDL